MIFIDSNVPMYLIGVEHPLQIDARLAVERAVAAGEKLVTDSEVFQEILHRYASIRRWEAIPIAFEETSRIVDEVFAVDFQDMRRAADIVMAERRLSARDAVHLAVMERYGVRRIISFDADFDAWPGISRIGVVR